jgi:23S rRNA pseudouridine2605 synthase
MEKDSERLNKYLALRLGISRREADDLISSGSVFINNHIANLGARVHEEDIVSVAGKVLSHDTNYKYFILNKPVGYVCSRRAQGENPTIYDALPKEMKAYKPVGRLDKNSSGLLLLSNDGDYAFKMTHPSFAKIKIYSVELNIELQPLHHQMIADYGIELEDGTSKFSLEKMDHDSKTWRVTMQEGRNRQIRRTFRALGYEVMKLHRTNFGPYALGDLKPGEFKEVEAL